MLPFYLTLQSYKNVKRHYCTFRNCSIPSCVHACIFPDPCLYSLVSEVNEWWIEETNVHGCEHKFSRTYGHIVPLPLIRYLLGHNLYELLTVKSIGLLSHVYCTQAIVLLSTDHLSDFFSAYCLVFLTDFSPYFLF